MAQPSFADWLNARLRERDWKGADLTRASKTRDNPRGLDSGLISRWRLQRPIGTVPKQVQTLQRLAAALRVPEREVYEAAGLLPADGSRFAESADVDPIDAAFHATNVQMRDAVRDIPPALWPTIVRAQLDQAITGARAMAKLLMDGPSALNGGVPNAFNDALNGSNGTHNLREGDDDASKGMLGAREWPPVSHGLILASVG